MMQSKADKILEQVEKVEAISKHCAEHTATKSVVAAMLYSLFFASRELLSSVDQMLEELTTFVVDEYRLDYVTLRRRISICMDYVEPSWKEEDIESIKEYDRENAERKIQAERDNGYDFGNCDEFDVKEVNHQLLSNYLDLKNNAYGTLKNIKAKLCVIIKEHENFDEEYNLPGGELLTFGNILKERYERMQKEYRETVWKDKVQKVKNKIRFNLKGTGKNEYIAYRDYYRSDTNDLISEYTESVPSEIHVVLYIYLNREVITISDLYELFEFIETCNLLEARILAFDVMGEPSGAYKDLFVNKACEQFVWNMVLPSCSHTKYEYAALLFAMMDLGLAQKDKKNASQFAEFVNRRFCEELKLDDISKRKRKLIRDSFGSMTEEQLEERFKEREREVLSNKYREYYDALDSALKGETDVDERTKWLISVINGEIADF